AGAYFFAGRLEDARAVIERAFDRLAGGDDHWSEAQLCSSLAVSRMIATDDAGATAAASRALEAAQRAANPSQLAYALAGKARPLTCSDPDTAVSLLDRARQLAEPVHNGWLLNLIIYNGLGAASERSGRTDDALAAFLDATDRTHRAGWTVHGWTAAWFVTAVLWRLGRRDEAALFLGACEASGAARLTRPPLPAGVGGVTARRGGASPPPFPPT